MPTDDFTPDLSKLEQDYQILTELHRSQDSRTYLARHLEMNRDVTITVVRRDSREGDGTTGTAAPSLSRYAGDVERLKTSRHPNVIPVIEGRWLADGSFAVVRARARGATLDQLVTATGAMQTARVAAALQQVKSAVDWARDNAIASRSIDPATMIFQQGSGRVLLAFEPRAAGVEQDDCEDSRQIGRLGWEMLAGEPFDASHAKSLAALRPDLSPQIVADTEALMQCTPGGAPNVDEYLTALSGTTPVVVETAVPVAVAVEPKAPAVTAPVAASSDAVVARKQGWGFGTRFAVGVAVVATIAIVAFLFMHPSAQPILSRTAAGGDQSAGEAAGSVSSNMTQPDTAVVASPTAGYPASQFSAPAPSPAPSMYPTPAPMPASPVPTPMPAPITSPATASPPASTVIPGSSTYPTSSVTPVSPVSPVTPLEPPTTRRHEPLATPAPERLPLPDSTGRRLDSLRATQDSLWNALDHKLRVHSDSSIGMPDTVHKLPPIPPVDTMHTAPPDTSVTTGGL
ncbi:MAG TPA: hypothetical protein VGM67_16550 [Gemmatimonadaceae bacterium]|jgi:hypothetical protein